ncbi:hypothetical protein CORC01_05453, partial [Colletotrichum orchidophilum]
LLHPYLIRPHNHTLPIIFPALFTARFLILARCPYRVSVAYLSVPHSLAHLNTRSLPLPPQINSHFALLPPTVTPSPSLPHHIRKRAHTQIQTQTHIHIHIRCTPTRTSVQRVRPLIISSPSLMLDAAVSRVPSHCSKRRAYARDGCIHPPPTLHVHIAVQATHTISLCLVQAKGWGNGRQPHPPPATQRQTQMPTPPFTWLLSQYSSHTLTPDGTPPSSPLLSEDTSGKRPASLPTLPNPAMIPPPAWRRRRRRPDPIELFAGPKKSPQVHPRQVSPVHSICDLVHTGTSAPSVLCTTTSKPSFLSAGQPSADRTVGEGTACTAC